MFVIFKCLCYIYFPIEFYANCFSFSVEHHGSLINGCMILEFTFGNVVWTHTNFIGYANKTACDITLPNDFEETSFI